MITLDLTGRVTLVVGGSRGIGAAIVRRAVEAGSAVAWTTSNADPAIQPHKELENNGARIQRYVVDAADFQQTQTMVNNILETWGRLDCVVYNAGVTDPRPMLEITPEEWRRLVEINLNGAFYTAKAVFPTFVRQGAGAAVLIGSAAVATGGGGRADYVSAKTGLEGFNRAITREFASKGVRCNVVHPSLIETDLLRKRHPDAEKRKTLAAEIPMRRLGQPDDIAYMTIFLLTDLASYITGQSIYIDGGRTWGK